MHSRQHPLEEAGEAESQALGRDQEPWRETSLRCLDAQMLDHPDALGVVYLSGTPEPASQPAAPARMTGEKRAGPREADQADRRSKVRSEVKGQRSGQAKMPEVFGARFGEVEGTEDDTRGATTTRKHSQ